MYRRPLFYLIVISALIRLLLASVLELGNDEVYYYTYGQHLQINYFDHPPGIALLIKLFTFNMHFKAEVFVRLGSIFCAAIGTLLIFKIGTFIKNKRTGWIAALLYNTSIYCSIIAGTFILPDSPQVIFWLLSLLIIFIIIDKYDCQRPVANSWWIIFGIANGLCIMCKIHGVFIWGGVGLFILFYKRDILVKTGPYLAFIITLLIISPIFWWNYHNHFITYNYHSSRVGLNNFKIDKDSFLQTILGQIVYNSPLNVVVTVIGIFICFKRKLLHPDYLRLLLLCGVPIILVVTVMSLFNTVLPHWSGPGFLTLSLLGAVFIDDLKVKRSVIIIPTLIKWMISFMLVLIISGIVFINFYPGTIGNTDKNKLGENDFTLDMYGWGAFGKSFDDWYNEEVEHKNLQQGIRIVDNKWFPAAHIDYYVASPIDTYVIGMGEINDLHHYAWLNNYRGNLVKGDNALCIVPSNYPIDVNSYYLKYFSSIKPLSTFAQYRGGKICRYFRVYLLQNLLRNN